MCFLHTSERSLAGGVPTAEGSTHDGTGAYQCLTGRLGSGYVET